MELDEKTLNAHWAKSEKDADYTIMKCNDCGYTWHYELNNN